MASSVTVQKEFNKVIRIRWVKKVIQHILKNHTQEPNATISVAFMDNDGIQELNAAYRGMNRPTDVLSFPGEYLDPETGRKVLGDIAISVPQVQSQADKAKNRFLDEVALMLVHGTLHLQGYDHGSAAEKKPMWEKQNLILTELKQQDWYEVV